MSPRTAAPKLALFLMYLGAAVGVLSGLAMLWFVFGRRALPLSTPGDWLLAWPFLWPALFDIALGVGVALKSRPCALLLLMHQLYGLFKITRAGVALDASAGVPVLVTLVYALAMAGSVWYHRWDEARSEALAAAARGEPAA